MTAADGTTLSKIPAHFISNRQGKEHVLYAGLLDLAHREGNLKGIHTTLVQAPMKENGFTAIVHATVEAIDGQHFDGIGDASPDSVGRMIIPHSIRMAETRAKARGLRDFLNVGGAAVEEFGAKGESEDDEDEPRQPALASPAQHAEMQAMAKKIFDAFGKDFSPYITDDMTEEGANILRGRFKATYDKLAAEKERPANVTQMPQAAPAGEPATEQQISKIQKLQAALGRPAIVAAGITAADAAAQITELVKAFNASQKAGGKAATR